MPVTVIVGGQFGSEGKGKVAHYLAKQKQASVAVRVGGSNSGHTVISEAGTPLVFRMLPTAAILPDITCVLAAGSYIDVDVLFDEIARADLSAHRLIIDPNAYVVTEQHKRSEAEWRLNEKIGSTQSGVGAALVDRIMRLSPQNLARNDERLAPFVAPVRSLLRSHLKRGEHIVLEGTQGFGLSLLHSSAYPKATSRDTTAATFVGEIGVSPLDVDDIVLVIRAFPIRVAGDSGPLPNEIEWNTISLESGRATPLVELTSVTKRVRRVARFDPTIVCDAIEANAPTMIILNHADYFDAESAGTGCLTRRVAKRLESIEAAIGRRLDLVGLGPERLVSRQTARQDLLLT